MDKRIKLNTYAIYPDNWDTKKWGEPPLLGYVSETDEYWAKYAAYDQGLLTYNFTFGPKAVPAKRKPKFRKRNEASNKVST